MTGYLNSFTDGSLFQWQSIVTRGKIFPHWFLSTGIGNNWFSLIINVLGSLIGGSALFRQQQHSLERAHKVFHGDINYSSLCHIYKYIVKINGQCTMCWSVVEHYCHFSIQISNEFNFFYFPNLDHYDSDWCCSLQHKNYFWCMKMKAIKLWEGSSRPIFGFRWADEGLKPWPCLGQKNPKMQTLNFH